MREARDQRHFADATKLLLALFFGGLFVGDTICRFTYGQIFVETSRKLDVLLGGGHLLQRFWRFRFPACRAMKFTEDSAPVKSCRILLAGCLSASWLVAASAHANTITVTNTSDSGRGSLRQAMANANDGDTINATNVSGSIELSSGELLVNKSVTINGPGHKRLSVENAGPSRVFEIAAGEIVTISGLAINNGQADSGGVCTMQGR